MLPPLANAQDVVENDVMIETPDGTADCYFVHPANGSHAAVLMWPDILGLRPAFRTMGKRLAQSGYSVLVVNPFYRSAKSPVVEEGESFGDPETREKVMPMARALNAQTHVTDAHAFVDWLDQQSAVDTSRKIGTMGYCMGGPMVMRTAAAIPERIGAGGSFHGGGLVTDNADSPHLGIENMEAHMWIAIAENDDERDPQAKEVLMDTFEETGVMAEIEVFEGAMHGWCVIDSTVYNEAQAERAWNRMLGIFETAL
jgi:carboxymethylenebutenolidase